MKSRDPLLGSLVSDFFVKHIDPHRAQQTNPEGQGRRGPGRAGSTLTFGEGVGGVMLGALPHTLAVLLLALAPASGFQPTTATPRTSVWPASRAPAVLSYDLRPDPAWQRDGIIILWGSGWQTLVRAAATGIKRVDELGFDVPALTSSLGGAAIAATAWVLAACATGVLGTTHRYSANRVLLTWMLAAPPAALLRALLYGGGVLDPLTASTDALLMLVLMVGLRRAEESGIV